jgi:hypothetical protein
MLKILHGAGKVRLRGHGRPPPFFSYYPLYVDKKKKLCVGACLIVCWPQPTCVLRGVPKKKTFF